MTARKKSARKRAPRAEAPEPEQAPDLKAATQPALGFPPKSSTYTVTTQPVDGSTVRSHI